MYQSIPNGWYAHLSCSDGLNSRLLQMEKASMQQHAMNGNRAARDDHRARTDGQVRYRTTTAGVLGTRRGQHFPSIVDACGMRCPSKGRAGILRALLRVHSCQGVGHRGIVIVEETESAADGLARFCREQARTARKG